MEADARRESREEGGEVAAIRGVLDNQIKAVAFITAMQAEILDLRDTIAKRDHRIMVLETEIRARNAAHWILMEEVYAMRSRDRSP